MDHVQGLVGFHVLARVGAGVAFGHHVDAQGSGRGRVDAGVDRRRTGAAGVGGRGGLLAVAVRNVPLERVLFRIGTVEADVGAQVGVDSGGLYDVPLLVVGRRGLRIVGETLHHIEQEEVEQQEKA